jgi:hypothetical protein
MSEHINIERARRAADLILFYAIRSKCWNEEADTIVTDVLTDLMHYAACKDIYFPTCIVVAQMYFEDEVAQEGGAA